MWSFWDGDKNEAVTRVHQSHCRVVIRADGPHLFIEGQRVFDPSAVDMDSAKRALERAAFRRSGITWHLGS